MNDPFFSICIPNYNYGHYIGHTIRSVLDQNYQTFEIIVSDNASTDDSCEVVQSFKDDRLRLFRNNYNVGFAPNLQRATQHARGDFLILLSSDDLMRPGALERYSEVIKDQGARADSTVIYSATDVIDAEGTTTSVLYLPPGQVFNEEVSVNRVGTLNLDGTYDISRGKEVLRRAIVECRYPGVFCATAYPRRLWDQVEGYDTTYQYMPDAAFLHKLLALDPDYVFVRKRLFAYRVHQTNQSALAAAQGALRLQVDGYMRTVNYPPAILGDLGISRKQLVNAYIDKLCMEESIRALASGYWLRAFKIFCFAFASYPGKAIRLPNTYLAGALIGLGPLGTLACSAVRKWRNRQTKFLK